MKKTVLALAILMLPGLWLAAAGDKRILEIYQCELKEGKTVEEVRTNNERWLVNTRKAAGSDDIRSYHLQPKVGDLTTFVFIDSYPDMATWAAAESAGESEESKAIEAAFEELMDCTKNRLYESTQH